MWSGEPERSLAERFRPAKAAVDQPAVYPPSA